MDRFDGLRRRGKRGLAAALVAAVALACGGGDRAGGDAALESLATKVEVIEFAGGEASRCVFSSPGVELCAWRIAPGDPAWAALAAEEGAEGELNLLCEFPLDGSARADGSCRAHPRAAQAASGMMGLPPVAAAGSVETHREAERRLGEALTVRAISDLVGDAPERCSTGQTAQTCDWRVDEGAAAYGLLASMVDDAGSGTTVRLRCVLPLDGAARGTDSCNAAWSD